MTPSAIHTYEHFPKMFPMFYLADYSKMSIFFRHSVYYILCIYMYTILYYTIHYRLKIDLPIPTFNLMECFLKCSWQGPVNLKEKKSHSELVYYY